MGHLWPLLLCSVFSKIFYTPFLTHQVVICNICTLAYQQNINFNLVLPKGTVFINTREETVKSVHNHGHQELLENFIECFIVFRSLVTIILQKNQVNMTNICTVLYHISKTLTITRFFQKALFYSFFQKLKEKREMPDHHLQQQV